jgi:hypothetical protein
MKSRSIILANLTFLCLLAVLLTEVDAHAGGFEPVNSLKWPLWNQHYTDADGYLNVERTRIWSYLGEPQERTINSQKKQALHSGNDFRGALGDVVKAVAPGNIWFTHATNDCRDPSGTDIDCRIYILGFPTNSEGEVEDEEDAVHQYVYYYSHLWWGDNSSAKNTPDDAIVDSNARFALENAAKGNRPYDGVQDGTAIEAGEVIAKIADFGGTSAPWHHLHFGIYDRLDNYNAIAPLTALEQNDNPYTYDAEDPRVEMIYIMADDHVPTPLPSNSEQPEGDCGTIARQNYHILADADDRFERAEDIDKGVKYDKWWVPEKRLGERISVHEARYIIQRVGDDDGGEERTWFNFDKMPFECTGEDRALCAAFTDEDFWDYSIDAPDGSGAVLPGLAYSDIIYHDAANMANGGAEYDNFLNLTNEWGEEGSWDATDTTKYPNGQYQITVRVFDQARREGQKTSWVYLGDDTQDCECSDMPPAIYLRDSPDDDGAIPSESPNWVSRDIVIKPHGESPAGENDRGINSSSVKMSVPYDVWVRVHRLNCSSTPTIEAKVTALNSSPILDPTDTALDPEYITDGYETGDSPVGFQNGINEPKFGHIGPFSWKPAYDGHRCLVARVKFIEEEPPIEGVDGELVQDDRRYTQRNLWDVDSETPSSFMIINPYPTATDIGMEFDARSLPLGQLGASVTLTVEYNAELYDAWSDVPGTAISTNAEGDIKLSLLRKQSMASTGNIAR